MTENQETLVRALNLIDFWIKAHAPIGSKILRALNVKEEWLTIQLEVPSLYLTADELKRFSGFKPKGQAYEPLTMARGFLSAVGGQLTTVSNKEEGTVFKIRVDTGAKLEELKRNIKILEKRLNSDS